VAGRAGTPLFLPRALAPLRPTPSPAHASAPPSFHCLSRACAAQLSQALASLNGAKGLPEQSNPLEDAIALQRQSTIDEISTPRETTYQPQPEALQKGPMIGAGGFATVWLVTDTASPKRRQYALKQLGKGQPAAAAVSRSAG